MDGDKIDHQALRAILSLEAKQGFMIHHIYGNMFGLNFSFLPKPEMVDEKIMTLIGKIEVDGGKLSPYLKGDFQEFFATFSDQ